MTEMHILPISSLQAVDTTDVLQAALESAAVLAMITNIEGRFYRPVGTMMALLADGTSVGQLSGGCVERDVRLRARDALTTRQVLTFRYGRGSPFIDLQLPCGSGIDVTLLPNPDPAPIVMALTTLAERRAAVLSLDHLPCVKIKPRIRVVVYGTGAEVSAFVRLTEAAGINTMIADPCDRPTIDPFTAVLLLFHDHDVETRILADMVYSSAFWIGAQGSALAHANRLEALRALDIAEADLAGVKGPIGLIKRARDPHTLAISALAEIVSHQP